MDLTEYQAELLTLLVDGPRYGINDKRIARALERKGLAKYYASSDAWDATPAGRKIARQRITDLAATSQKGNGNERVDNS